MRFNLMTRCNGYTVSSHYEYNDEAFPSLISNLITNVNNWKLTESIYELTTIECKNMSVYGILSAYLEKYELI